VPDLNKTDWEILNVMADDSENLEQIYLGVCFEFVEATGADGRLHPSYRRLQPVLLEEIASRIRHLVDMGLLQPEGDENGQPLINLQDLSYVWRAWFRMTAEGRRTWDESEFSDFVARK
jgi:hypothetical protein